ncbi:HU family DNA-binding protein [Planktothrix prolifica]|uniref:HU family DNA-binding protein n=1 Tax=Planktothrix prolifica TaxID=54307 RepID=UPI0009DBAF28|nr:HU family DNA-binding protein [Planktothrix prolifica]
MLDTNYIEKLTGYSGSTVESVLEGFIKFVQLELRAGNEVEIPKFGVFYPKEFGERKSRNPRTGEHLIAKARTKPRLRFFDSFEKSIQDSDSTPTTVVILN